MDRPPLPWRVLADVIDLSVEAVTALGLLALRAAQAPTTLGQRPPLVLLTTASVGSPRALTWSG